MPGLRSRSSLLGSTEPRGTNFPGGEAHSFRSPNHRRPFPSEPKSLVWLDRTQNASWDDHKLTKDLSKHLFPPQTTKNCAPPFGRTQLLPRPRELALSILSGAGARMALYESENCRSSGLAAFAARPRSNIFKRVINQLFPLHIT